MPTYIAQVIVLLLLLLGVAPTWQTASAAYTVSDLYWYAQLADGSKQRTELISQLSRQHVLVGVKWSDIAEQNQKLPPLQHLAQEPSTLGATITQATPGPGGSHFASYVLTTSAPQSVAAIIALLNTAQSLSQIDFALPIFQLQQDLTAPFIDFMVLRATQATPEAFTLFLQGQSVTVLRQSDRVYALQFEPQAKTNLLAMIHAFEQAPEFVDHVRVRWLDITLPQPLDLHADIASSSVSIEAHTSLDTGWNAPLAYLRELVRYTLRITRAANVTLRPESIAPTALRRELVRTTGLPAALFDVSASRQQPVTLSDQRIQETIVYTLQFSKPGTYRIPALPIRYVTPQSPSAPTSRPSLPKQGYELTIPSYLSAQASPLPAHLIAPPIWQRSPLSSSPYVAYSLLGVGGIMLAMSRLGWRPKQRPAVPATRLSPSQLRSQYLTAYQSLRDRQPNTATLLSPTERMWLRDCASLLRRFLGEWAHNDAAYFTGGAGVSSAMMRAHIETDHSDDTRLTEALQLLDSLDMTATAMAPALTPEAYAQVSESVEQTIFCLTDREAPHASRVSSSA